MTAEKPADDGALHGPRRDDTQLPNRAVYIALKNDVGRKTEHRRVSPRDAGRAPAGDQAGRAAFVRDGRGLPYGAGPSRGVPALTDRFPS